MQAIITKFLCPTNFKGSRYKASCEAGSITISADDALNIDGNHKAACDALCAKLDARNTARYGAGMRAIWSLPKAIGTIPSGEHVHVFLEPAAIVVRDHC
jgi:hypothetical protein